MSTSLQERSAAALDAYSEAVIDVAERLAPSVANLRVLGRRRDGAQVTVGAGSAIVLTADGFLLTSAHVVAAPRGRGRARTAWPPSPTVVSCASTSSARIRSATWRSCARSDGGLTPPNSATPRSFASASSS